MKPNNPSKPIRITAMVCSKCWMIHSHIARDTANRSVEDLSRSLGRRVTYEDLGIVSRCVKCGAGPSSCVKKRIVVKDIPVSRMFSPDDIDLKAHADVTMGVK